MERNLFSLTIYLVVLGCCFVGCSSTSEAQEVPGTDILLATETSSNIPSPVVAIVTPTVSTTPIPTKTSQPKHTLTETPVQIELPEVTMSTEEAEAVLVELLRTNGNCSDKCLAGIWPDKMNVQDAINVMAKWGKIEIVENFEGHTFITLDQNPLGGRVKVYLSLGTWTKRLDTIDRLHFRIEGVTEEHLGEKDHDFWLENRAKLFGFQFDSILKAYGVPSYVGFFFQTNDEPGTVLYTMNLHYEQIDVVVYQGALASSDDGNLFICPAKDPHDLRIDIYPEQPMKELEEFYPVTWDTLTGAKLDDFYSTFTNDNHLSDCFETTFDQIQVLQPGFGEVGKPGDDS